jgi:hypothetical protein
MDDLDLFSVFDGKSTGAAPAVAVPTKKRSIEDVGPVEKERETSKRSKVEVKDVSGKDGKEGVSTIHVFMVNRYCKVFTNICTPRLYDVVLWY